MQRKLLGGHGRTAFWFIGAAAMLALPLTSCSRSSPGSATSSNSAQEDPPTRVARLASLQGNVSFEPAGDSTWSKATPNYSVTAGDRLYTEANSHAELDIGSEAVRVGPASDVTVTNLTDHFVQVGLAQGTMNASIYKWDPSDSMEVDTPNGTLIPKAAGTYKVTIDQSGATDPTYVTVESGSLEVSGPGVDQVVPSGQSVELSGTDPIQITNLSGAGTTAAVTPTRAPEDASFDRWSSDRDELYRAPSPDVQYVNQSTPGWEDLFGAGVGVWLTDANYGRVWRPEHLRAGWAPYREGHWAWIDPYGWTWVDDEPWGYATMHFGRWADLSLGWSWVPGPADVEPVYAPALVSFVDVTTLGPSFSPDAQAWFPLAPGEPYYPWYHHSDDYARAVNVANLRGVANVNQLIDPANVGAVQWKNRSSALTMVPGRVFAGGDPVARSSIRVQPAEAQLSRVAPHPTVNPDVRAYAGGPPAPRPPVAARPMMIARNATPDVVPTTRGMQAPRVGGGVAAAPAVGGRTVNQRGVAQSTAGGEVAAPVVGRTRAGAPVVGRTPAAPRVVGRAPAAAPAAVAAPRTLITRNPPPETRTPVSVQRPAMEAHPGRPLEPQQVQNVRAGKPAGPPRDVEVPPHVTAPAAAPVRQPPAAAPVRQPPPPAPVRQPSAPAPVRQAPPPAHGPPARQAPPPAAKPAAATAPPAAKTPPAQKPKKPPV